MLNNFIIDSRKHGTHKVLVDKEDYHLVTDKTMYLSKSGQFLYVRVGKDKKFLHRLVTNAPKGKVVDHINRNTLDNRKSNLKVCTIQENLRNQKRPNNKTGHTGVAVHPSGKYTAQIKHNYKRKQLGIFDTIEQALKARKKAELELWGRV